MTKILAEKKSSDQSVTRSINSGAAGEWQVRLGHLHLFHGEVPHPTPTPEQASYGKDKKQPYKRSYKQNTKEDLQHNSSYTGLGEKKKQQPDKTKLICLEWLTQVTKAWRKAVYNCDDLGGWEEFWLGENTWRRQFTLSWPGDDHKAVLFCFVFFFFFLLHPRHVEIPGPGIEPEPQQWQHWIPKCQARELQDCLFFNCKLHISSVHFYVYMVYFTIKNVKRQRQGERQTDTDRKTKPKT